LNKAYFWLNFTLIEIIVISTFFVFPLSYLVVIQTQNILMNTTTNMRFASKKNKDLSNDGVDK